MAMHIRTEEAAALPGEMPLSQPGDVQPPMLS